MRTKLGLFATSVIAAMMLNACGDEGGNGNNGPSNADQIVASYDDLTLCTAKREGATAYVKDEKTEYMCIGERWVPADDIGSSFASSSAGGSSAGVSESGRSSAADDGQSNEANLSFIDQSSASDSNLGACATANDGEIKQDVASSSVGHVAYYVCDNGDWREATNQEREIYGWNEDADGNLRRGPLTQTIYKYDSLQARWLAANSRDTSLGLNGCTQKRWAEVGISNDDKYYFCGISQWQNASGLEYVRYAKTCAHDAELIVGSATDADKYVCDADTFRVATDSEKSINRGCTCYNLNEEKLLVGNVTCSQSGVWLASTNTVAGTLTYGGQTYKTIGIGTQMWMAENLNYEYKRRGSTYGNWCYKNAPDSCAKYGRLYTWGAAMDSMTTGCGRGTTCAASSGKVQGICPFGWHLPSHAEWNTLITAVGDSAGIKLKSTTGWPQGTLGIGTDAYGFSGLPSGWNNVGNFYNAGIDATFWSSSEDTQDEAYTMHLYYISGHQPRDNKYYGFAVRCVKD